jgi:hypothetical protein
LVHAIERKQARSEQGVAVAEPSFDLKMATAGIGLLGAKAAALVSRDAEREEVRAHSLQQEARIRALHDQLSTFIRKDADEAARAQVRRSLRARAEGCRRRPPLLPTDPHRPRRLPSRSWKRRKPCWRKRWAS